MSGKGGGSSQTVTQNADPWGPQQQYLKNLFGRAESLYSQGGLAPAYYPGETLAAQDPWTAQALQMQADRALAGSDVTRAAQNQLIQTLDGEVNPYLDDMVQRATGQALSSVNSNFAQAGRYGSGAHEAAAGDTAANIATQMYGQAYDKDRQRQIQAMMFAPSLAAADYQDIAALSEAGVGRENYAQDIINAAIDRYNYQAGQPLTALQNYGALVQGNYGMSGTSTQAQKNKSNPLGGMAGGALTGASIGTTISPGWGTAIGAIGGGLLGLFGSM